MGTTGLAMRQHAALSIGSFSLRSQHAVHCAAPPARNPSPEPRAMAPGEGSPPDAFLAAYEAAQALAARLPKSPPRPSTAALLAQVRESCGLPACGLPASGPGVPRVLFWGGEGGRGRARSGDAGAAARLVRPRERAGSFLRRRRACTPNAAAAPRCDGTARPPSPRQPALAPKFAPRRPADALAARGAREVGNKTAARERESLTP